MPGLAMCNTTLLSRELNTQRRTHVFLRFHPDPASVVFDDFSSDCETHSRACSFWLRCEERRENSGVRFRRDAAAVIHNVDMDAFRRGIVRALQSDSWMALMADNRFFRVFQDDQKNLLNL